MQTLEEKLKKLEADLSEASQMAMTAMTSSSDMGLIIHFLKKSFEATTLPALAHELIDQLASIGLNSAVLIKTPSGPNYTSLSGDDNLIDQAFMERNRGKGRIHESAELTLVNYPHISLLINNMSDDPVQRGRFRDTLATLMECVEVRVMGLIAEQQHKEAQRAKDEFFAIMSHELKTPLNPIIGLASLLERKISDKISDREASALGTIKTNGELLLSLINDLLDLARLESGEIALHQELFDANEVISKLGHQVHSFAETRKTAITILPQSELNIFADRTRFSQIILNLITNAIKYSPEGEVTLSAIYTDDESLGNTLLISVKDNGIGIKPEDQERIFHHFTQLDTKTNRNSNGTGIGLYITRELVKMHGGRIELDSEFGVGSEFKVFIPNSAGNRLQLH